METYYIKKKNGRYEAVGTGSYRTELPYGLWYTQKVEHGSRGTSIPYWLGDLNLEYVKLPNLVKIMSLDDKVAKFIMNNQEQGNKSAGDLAKDILRLIYKELDK